MHCDTPAWCILFLRRERFKFRGLAGIRKSHCRDVLGRGKSITIRRSEEPEDVVGGRRRRRRLLWRLRQCRHHRGGRSGCWRSTEGVDAATTEVEAAELVLHLKARTN